MPVFKIAAVLAACAALVAAQHKVSDEDVQRVHRSALLLDTHNDLPENLVRGVRGKHTDPERLRRGGVGAVFFAAYVDSRYGAKGQGAQRAIEMIDTIREKIVAAHPEAYQLALSADDVETARKNGRIAALIGVEGGYAINNSLAILRDLYARGARYMTLTHIRPTDWADAAGYLKPVPEVHNGLTDFGREVVREMNRLGMIVDVSHVSDKTFRDVLAVTTKPPIASHSSCRALTAIPRNMTDEMIAALAKKGGVIQINIGCEFLTGKPGQRATLDDVVAHIDHAVKAGGIGAVGIGTDFDGVSCTPDGLADVSQFPNLTRALLEKGYSEADIRKIYSGNTLRVMRANQP